MALPNDSDIVCDLVPDTSGTLPASKRKRFASDQLSVLITEFEKNHTPSFEIRENLAKKLSMTNREVQVWFQNRRAKANRMKANPQRRFMYYPSMNINDTSGQANTNSPNLTMNTDTNSFLFVPVTVGQDNTEFQKSIYPTCLTRKIAPAPIKITSYDDTKLPPFTSPFTAPTSTRYTIPDCISTFRRGHRRHYSYQGAPLNTNSFSTNLTSGSPVTPDLPNNGSDITVKINPEMVKVKPKSHSAPSLPSIRDILGHELYSLPQVGPTKPNSR